MLLWKLPLSSWCHVRPLHDCASWFRVFLQEEKNIKIYSIRLEVLEGHSLTQLCIFRVPNASLFSKTLLR